MKGTQQFYTGLEKLKNLLDNKVDIIKRKFESRGLTQEIYNEPRERPSLIKTNLIFKHYGYVNTFIVDPHSEGEDTDSEERFKEASIKEVMSSIIDYNTIMTVKNLEDFPREASPGLLFMNLDEWMNSIYLKQFIEEIPVFNERNLPEIESMSLFQYKKHLMAIVKFKKLSDIEKIHDYFNHPYKKNKNPCKNSNKETIEVFYSYELQDLTLSYYYAVILRNLPQNCSHEDVKYYCETRAPGVYYALYPLKIQNSYCSVVVYRELDDAEKLCNYIKKELTKLRKIKAHIHPRSCKIRRHPERSHFSKMLAKKNSIKFPSVMVNSSGMIAKSLSLVKVFNQLYETKNKNNWNETNANGNKTNEENSNKNKDKEMKTNKDAAMKQQDKNEKSKITNESVKDYSYTTSSRLMMLLPTSPINSKSEVNEIKQNLNSHMDVEKFPIFETKINEKEEINTNTAITVINPITANTANTSSTVLVVQDAKLNLNKPTKTKLGINNLGKALEVLTKKTNSIIPIAVKSESTSTSFNNLIPMEVDTSVNTNSLLADSSINEIKKEEQIIIEPNNIIIKPDTVIIPTVIPEMSEKEIQFYNYMVKDRSHYEMTKQEKSRRVDKDDLANNRRKQSNFSSRPSIEESSIKAEKTDNYPKNNNYQTNNRRINNNIYGYNGNGYNNNNGNNFNNNMQLPFLNNQFTKNNASLITIQNKNNNNNNNNVYNPYLAKPIQPTIINNVNINMINNPLITTTKIVNNLIVNGLSNNLNNHNNQITNTFTANQINSVYTLNHSNFISNSLNHLIHTTDFNMVIEPPKDEALPPLPIEEAAVVLNLKTEEKVEPGQILSDEENYSKKEDLSNKAINKHAKELHSNNYDKDYIKRKRVRSRSISKSSYSKNNNESKYYRDDRDKFKGYKEKDRDRDTTKYNNRDKYRRRSRSHSSSLSGSKSKSITRTQSENDGGMFYKKLLEKEKHKNDDSIELPRKRSHFNQKY